MAIKDRIVELKIPSVNTKCKSRFIYVYRITSVHTGHFYIGQSINIIDRMTKHLSGVYCHMRGKKCSWALPFYSRVAGILMPIYTNGAVRNINSFILKSFNVDIIATAADKETAHVIENYHLQKHIADPMCLNVIAGKNSKYPKKYR